MFQRRVSFSPPLQPAIRKFGLLFIGCLLFHAAGTWTLPLVDRDEPRFAEASREMLERGDYIVPYLNNRHRFDKPPLIYWLQSTSYRLLGETDFAARLPSVIAGALTALLLFAWGRRVADERVGFWAALMFTICFQTVVHAKAAVADMWMVFFVAAAQWAGYELLRDRLKTDERRTPSVQRRTSNEESVAPCRRWWWIFYVSLAFGFLAKGPVGWMPLLSLAATKLLVPDLTLNRRFLFLTGMLFALSIVALWGIPALMRTNGEFFRVGIGRHVVERSLVAMEGHGAKSIWAYIGSLPFYFVLIFLSFFPWALKLPWLAQKLWRKRDPLDGYLIAGIAVVFITFTFVKTKLPHYTLPAFPLLALLLAKAFADLPSAQRLVRRMAIGTGCAALLVAAATPFVARLSPALQLVSQARNDLKPEMEFGAIDYKEPSLIWYFRRHVDGFFSDLDSDLLGPFLEKPGARFVIVPTTKVAELLPASPSHYKRYTARGINTANGKWVDLTLILKPQ